eukprot:Gb_38076 [translate_table: standard]
MPLNARRASKGNSFLHMEALGHPTGQGLHSDLAGGSFQELGIGGRIVPKASGWMRQGVESFEDEMALDASSLCSQPEEEHRAADNTRQVPYEEATPSSSTLENVGVETHPKRPKLLGSSFLQLKSGNFAICSFPIEIAQENNAYILVLSLLMGYLQRGNDQPNFPCDFAQSRYGPIFLYYSADVCIGLVAL